MMGYFGRPDGPIPEVLIVTYCPECGRTNPRQWSSSGPGDERVYHVSRVCVKAVCRALSEEAAALGCTCEWIDGRAGVSPTLIKHGCPVHFPPKRESS